tara:strand:- start:5442 stop:5651 length:210 start_codon:yes stop_codon:yes gene_type:complete
MKKVTRNEVKDGNKYLIKLSDCYGEYNQEVTAKFYKPGSMKCQLKAKFRFIDEYNRIIPARYAEEIFEV